MSDGFDAVAGLGPACRAAQVSAPGAPADGPGFLASSVPYLLARASLAVNEGFERDMRHRGLGSPVWRSLLALRDHGALGVSALGRAALASQSNTSKTLVGMRAAGLVEEARVATDRRVVLIALTEAGLARAEAVAALAEAHEVRVLSRHPQAGAPAVREALAAVAKSWA